MSEDISTALFAPPALLTSARSLLRAELIANVSQTVATSFVSAFVDHRSTGDVLWLSALNEDRCKQQCGNGVLAIRSTDLRTFTSTDTGFKGKTCNTEVAKVASSPSLPKASNATG